MSEVEQADRDAARGVWRNGANRRSKEPDWLVQAFARHRTASIEAATADLRERLAEVEGVLREYWAESRRYIYDKTPERREKVIERFIPKIDALLGEPK